MEMSDQQTGESFNEFTAEDVSDWTRDLSDVILVQRARVRNITDKSGIDETEKRKLESLESLLREAIIAHDARYKKLGADNAARSDINEAYYKLESLKTRLREAIIALICLVRKLRTNRAGESEIEEAVERLESLKADHKAATGSEWSEVREEGPILLTTNAVKGKEILPELKERLKELRIDNVIR